MLFSMKSDALTLLGTPPLSTAATHRQFALIKINVIISTKLDKYLLNGVRVCVSLCVREREWESERVWMLVSSVESNGNQRWLNWGGGVLLNGKGRGVQEESVTGGEGCPSRRYCTRAHFRTPRCPTNRDFDAAKRTLRWSLCSSILFYCIQ